VKLRWLEVPTLCLVNDAADDASKLLILSWLGAGFFHEWRRAELQKRTRATATMTAQAIIIMNRIRNASTATP